MDKPFVRVAPGSNFVNLNFVAMVLPETENSKTSLKIVMHDGSTFTVSDQYAVNVLSVILKNLAEGVK